MTKKKIAIILGVILIVIILLSSFFCLSLRKVSNKNEIINFVVNNGDSKEEIVDNLKNANLIRNKYVTLIYIFLSGNTNIQAGKYELKRDMSTGKIIEILANGDIMNSKKEEVTITFNEGITLKEYLKLLADNTVLEYDEIIEEINEKEFLNNLINEYWFLTEDILKDDIYYALEGYLFPNTYNFYVDTTLESAIKKILNETSKRLEEFKEEIENSKYNIHEIFTMASIVEKEAVSYEDRTKVSQVIYKRLDINMNLGMDVTTYYGVGKSMKENLTNVDLNDDNPYNTRRTDFLGLPIGPICNPSIESIKAVLEPADTKYVYFYADIITGNVYFTDSYEEFLELKEIYG